MIDNNSNSNNQEHWIYGDNLKRNSQGQVRTRQIIQMVVKEIAK